MKKLTLIVSMVGLILSVLFFVYSKIIKNYSKNINEAPLFI